MKFGATNLVFFSKVQTWDSYYEQKDKKEFTT